MCVLIFEVLNRRIGRGGQRFVLVFLLVDRVKVGADWIDDVSVHWAVWCVW